jgi:DNA-binding MarR family transcriptional regulator
MKSTQKKNIKPKTIYDYSELELLITSTLYVHSNLTKKELREITKLNKYVLNNVLNNLLAREEICFYPNFEDLRGNIYYLPIKYINDI